MVVTLDAKSELSGGDLDELPPAYSESESSVAYPPPTIDGSRFGGDPLPTFASSSSSSATTPQFRAPLSRPTNFLRIECSNQSIKGTHSVDPTLRAPPGVIPIKGYDGKDINLRLASTNGAIDVVVDLVKGVDAKGPARLEVGSENGSVKLNIYDHRQSRFHLFVSSRNGSITVGIPSTFIGVISTKLNNGSLKFANEVQARLTTFSDVKREGRYFIGDYAALGYENDHTWLMDLLRIEAGNGGVKVAFVEEENAMSR